MADAAAARCPRCGGQAVLRLGEYECRRCGHFYKAQTADSAAARAGGRTGAGSSGRMHQVDTAGLLDTPQPAASRFLNAASMDLRGVRLAAEKRLFLILMAVLLSLGNCVALLDPGAPFWLYFWLVIGALLLTCLTALTLYVDWSVFQYVLVVLLICALGFYCYTLVTNWSVYALIRQIKLCVDGVLLVWLIRLLWCSARANE